MKRFPSRGRARTPRQHKHLTYFKLEQALAGPGCALCALARASVADYLDAFLYEKVNDVGLRTRFNRDAGLCAHHAGQLLGSRDGLAIATMYRPLLERAVAAITQRSDAPANRGDCFVCDVEREAEERFAAEAAAFLGDAELEAAVTKSGGFCLPHYEAVRRAASVLPDWYVELHAAKLTRLLDGVKRYLDAANWSLGDARPKLSRDEMRIARDVIGAYYGMRGAAEDVAEE